MLDDLVEVVPLELAGRGSRMQEPIMTSAREHGEDVAAAIDSHLGASEGDDYFIWSHSMGTLIAYETYHALRRRRESQTEPTRALPAHMVFSGRTPPHISVIKTDYYRLGDEEFIDAVDTYGGGTAAILRASDELRELFLPILRADFEVSETYQWSNPGAAIDCPVTVLNGAEDPSLSLDLLSRWQDLVIPPITDRRVPGGHFFIFEQDDLVRETVHAAVAAVHLQTPSLTGKATS